MHLTLALDPQAERRRIEGPTARQIARAKARYADLRDRARGLLDADPDAAFALDVDAFDLEIDFLHYGIDVTGGDR